MDRNEVQRVDDLFEVMLKTLADSEMSHEIFVMVLTKILVSICLNAGMTREQFMHQMGYAYDMENFMRPKSDEVH